MITEYASYSWTAINTNGITFALAQRLYDCNLFFFSQSINTNRLVEERRAFFNILRRRIIVPSVLTWTVFYTMCLQVRRFLISAVCVLFLYFLGDEGACRCEIHFLRPKYSQFCLHISFFIGIHVFSFTFQVISFVGKVFFSFSELRFPEWMIEPNPECLVNAKRRGFQFCTCKSSSSSSSLC